MAEDVEWFWVVAIAVVLAAAAAAWPRWPYTRRRWPYTRGRGWVYLPSAVAAAVALILLLSWFAN